MTTSQEICTALIDEVERRLIGECHTRIEKCVSMLTNQQVWWRPNSESNSIGNLILHLEGNVRQWIISGIGERVDTRQRQSEFEAHETMSPEELLDHLRRTMKEAKDVLATVKPDMLLVIKPVQTFEESVLSILVHVTEHFSYHTGQIAYITKQCLDEQLGFYEGVVLE